MPRACLWVSSSSALRSLRTTSHTAMMWGACCHTLSAAGTSCRLKVRLSSLPDFILTALHTHHRLKGQSDRDEHWGIFFSLWIYIYLHAFILLIFICLYTNIYIYLLCVLFYVVVCLCYVFVYSSPCIHIIMCICGTVVIVPSFESTGTSSNPASGSQCAAHPAVHPFFRAGQ